MITLLILAIAIVVFAIVSIVELIAIGAGAIFTFGDIAICCLIIWSLVKHIIKKLTK